MSFVYNPTYFRLPRYPNASNSSINGFWCGKGTDNGALVYLWNGRYVMTTGQFGNFIRIGTTNYTPSHFEVNGYVWYSNNSNYLYYSKKYGTWVLCSKFPGYEPTEVYDNEKQAWTGDAFYSGSIPSASDGATANFSPRGTNRNGGGSAQTATYYFPRWEKATATSTVTGEYLPKETNTGNKYFGLPRWRDNRGTYYIKSLVRVGSYYTYGTIRNVSGKWLIGDVGSTSGWHEGSEPSKTGSVTFLFKRNEGSTVTGYDLTLTLYDYVLGEERSQAYLGEVAIWR